MNSNWILFFNGFLIHLKVHANGITWIKENGHKFIPDFFGKVGWEWIHKYMCDRWILNTISSLKYMFNIVHTDYFILKSEIIIYTDVLSHSIGSYFNCMRKDFGV